MKMTEEEIQKQVEYLFDEYCGTCEHFNPSEYSDEVISRLDQEMFNCEQCDWWCEMSEMTDNDGATICTDCESDE